MKCIINLLLLIPILSFSQEYVISGQVANKSKTPVRNANIFIEGTYDGASTDSLGNYQFTTSAKGNNTIKVSAIGYISQTINKPLNKNTTLNFVLENDLKIIDEVIIQAGHFRSGNLSQSVMSPLDIVTTAGSNGNIVAALEKLPGTQIAQENGRLMVRGGTPNETQTYINGIRVAQPYTNTSNGVPVRGRFSPYLFKGINFSTGGYSAEYGNALSSILNLNTDLNLDQSKTDISISNVALGLSNAKIWENTSLSFNTGYTNLKPYSEVLHQNITWTKPYEQFSSETILKNKGKKHFFNLYAAYAFEKMGIKDYAINFDQEVFSQIQSNNTYINSTYIQYLSQNWKLESGASLGLANKNTTYHEYTIPNHEYHIHLKSKATKKLSTHLQYTLGTEYFFDKFNENLSAPNSSTLTYGYEQKNAAIFATTNIKTWKKLYLEAGLRYSTDFIKNTTLDPRTGLTFQLNNKNQVSFAYGIFHQSATEEISKFKNTLDWSQAIHYILNYNYAVQGKQLRVELFQKDYHNLIQFNSTTPNNNSIYLTNGYGKVKGIDIFWKDQKTIQNLQYWISYSFTDAKKLEHNYPISVQPNYVAKHYLSVVGKYWISQWRSQIGFTNSFSSGRPYNNPNETAFMASKTKNSNELSINWSYLITQQKILHLSLTNVLGQSPIYGYKYSQTTNPQGLYNSQTIGPTSKRFLFVGFFWTISKNKKENNLENL